MVKLDLKRSGAIGLGRKWIPLRWLSPVSASGAPSGSVRAQRLAVLRSPGELKTRRPGPVGVVPTGPCPVRRCLSSVCPCRGPSCPSSVVVCPLRCGVWRRFAFRCVVAGCVGSLRGLRLALALGVALWVVLRGVRRRSLPPCVAFFFLAACVCVFLFCCVCVRVSSVSVSSVPAVPN